MTSERLTRLGKRLGLYFPRLNVTMLRVGIFPRFCRHGVPAALGIVPSHDGAPNDCVTSPVMPLTTAESTAHDLTSRPHSSPISQHDGRPSRALARSVHFIEGGSSAARPCCYAVTGTNRVHR